jgi:hypothetical protein
VKNVINLIIKYVLVTLVLAVLIPVYGRSTWGQTLIVALAITILSYLAGDMWILPKAGNIIAVAADFGMAALLLWVMERALPQFRLRGAGVWVIALVIGIAELLFHFYLERTQAPGKNVNPT